MKTAWRIALVATFVAGCASQVRPTPTSEPSTVARTASVPTAAAQTSAPPPTTLAAATPEPFDQQFGPHFPAQPPAGDLVAIDAAWLSADQQSLTVAFVGAPDFFDANPCSEEYRPWVGFRGDELDVAVVNVHRAHTVPFATNVFCALVAHTSWFHLRLPVPFSGTTVHDLHGGALVVGKPKGLLVATALPAGWSLQRWLEWVPPQPGTWYEIYAADYRLNADGAQQIGGPGQLVLYQRLGTTADWRDIGAGTFQAAGATPVAVQIDGAATVWADASGDLFAAWTLGGQSLAMVGNAADMTALDLGRFANSVIAATP